MILITGARGFIGSGLVARLAGLGKAVIPVLRSDSFRSDNGSIFLDLAREEHLEKLKKLDIRADTVIHLAGHIEIALRPNGSDPTLAPVPGDENMPVIYRSNLLATINLIKYCKETGVKHFIFASSQAVYGLPGSELVTEETPCNPLEHYALSKECCEKVLRLSASDTMAVTVFRFPGIYSENRGTGAVARFCKSAKKTGVIRVTADLPLPFDVLHLEDVLNAFSCAVASQPKGYENYNIATGEPNNLNLLAGRIAALVPGCRVEQSSCLQPVIRMDSSKAGRKLGWKAESPDVRLQQVLDAVQE